MTPAEDSAKNIYLVNKVDNPDAQMNSANFSGSWNWIEAPADWNPQDGLPGGTDRIDGIMVFARKYQEKEALGICKAVRGNTSFDQTPLLVAISMYQMPLGNSVKKLPNADLVFMPLQEKELSQHLNELEQNISGGENNSEGKDIS